MLKDVIKNANSRHKQIAKDLIYASEKEVSIVVKKEQTTAVSGSTMFGDLETEDTEETKGPFKTIWVDADSASASENSREAAIVGRYTPVDVVAKFWLEDLLLDTDLPYGKTYLDKAVKIVSENNNNAYAVVGYDRYGLGTAANPYIIVAALRGGVGQ